MFPPLLKHPPAFLRNGLLLSFAAILLGAFPAVHAQEAPAAKTTLKILTWNVQLLPTIIGVFSDNLNHEQALRTPWIIEYLNQQDYDVVVLQEVLDPILTPKLKEGLKERYPYIVDTASKLGVVSSSGGILFASRIPITLKTHIIFKNVAGVDKIAEKGCTLVEAEKDGVRFQIAGTHLQAGHNTEKEKQYGELFEGIIQPNAKNGVPQILAGDLNTQPQDDRFQRMLKATEMQAYPMDDPSPYSIDGENSWYGPAKKGSKPDHVLLNPRGTGSRIVQQTIQRARKEHEGKTVDLADHYGVIAVIALQGN